MIVKICANTRREDIEAADRAGADLVGVVVEIAVSRRSVSRVVAKTLFTIPTNADKAMLLCDHPTDDACAIIDLVKPYAVHFTGSEPPEAVWEIRKRFRLKLFKSIHLPAAGKTAGTNGVFDRIAAYAEVGVKFIVLDTSDPSRQMYGGTGLVNDWNIAAEIVAGSSLPVLLAGGINPDNVCDAIERVRPYGIDLATGVEKEIGIKDPVKINTLFDRIRHCIDED